MGNLSKQRILLCAVTSLGCLALTACQTVPASAEERATSAVEAETLFQENTDAIPFGNDRRRKWDSPVIADLDQDGLLDVIVTEHGNKLRLFWNNGGTFSQPHTLLIGDMHGVAVSDYDRDGRMDMIIAQGGGDGANPKRPILLHVDTDRSITKRQVLDYFEPGRGRAVKFLDPDNDGVLDLLVTGFPLATQKSGANHFYRNAGDGLFEFSHLLPQARWLGYRTITTGFAGDGDADVLFFGGANMVAAKNGDAQSYTNENANIFGNLSNTADMTNAAEIDFDNDGDMDLFLTRAAPQFQLESYYDADSETFAFITFRTDFLHDLQVDGDLQIENLQRTFPHFDVYLGADRDPLPEVRDRHAGRDLTLSPEDAMGWPEGETKAGLYIGYLGDGMWRIGGQSRSRLAAVVRNVKSAPEGLSVPKEMPVRLLENRGGTFVDATARLGIDIKGQTTGAAVGDFNNDGWSDLAILRYGSMAGLNRHLVYLNQGGTSFVEAQNHGLASTEVGTTGGAIEAFDYNSDGAMDLIYSDERGRWHLMANNFGAANLGYFMVVKVGNSPSGDATAMGAQLTLKACGQTYARSVGAGSAAFSQSMNTHLHVGLGTCRVVDSATVRWTNGESSTVVVPPVNGTVTIGS